MTDDMIRHQSTRLMAVLGTFADRTGISPADMCSIATLAALGISTNLRGPVGAVEHLRDVADAVEGNLLASVTGV